MESSKKRLGAGRVAFLARMREIKERLDAGYTMIVLYDKYQEELGISYGQFVNYVNKFIRIKPEAPTKEKETESTKKKPKEGFTINPKIDKDLY